MIDTFNEADAIYRNRVKENYGFYEWGGHTKEGDRDVRITDFVLTTEEFREWQLAEKEDLPAANRQRRITRYVFASAGSATTGSASAGNVTPANATTGNATTLGKSRRLVATIFECNSVIDAHESLIDVVMTYMAPKLPRCGTKGLEIGDICFTGHGELNVSVIFARFNILAEIQSVGPEPASVDDFARSVDAMIYGRYVSAKGT